MKQTDPVVVTATKVETPESHLGAAVSIVTEDEVPVQVSLVVGSGSNPYPVLRNPYQPGFQGQRPVSRYRCAPTRANGTPKVASV